MVTVIMDNDIVSKNIKIFMFDGDTVTCKGVYTIEANEELKSFLNSKQNFIDFGCSPLRTSTGDALQSIYALTKVLNDTKITPSKSIQYK